VCISDKHALSEMNQGRIIVSKTTIYETPQLPVTRGSRQPGWRRSSCTWVSSMHPCATDFHAGHRTAHPCVLECANQGPTVRGRSIWTIFLATGGALPAAPRFISMAPSGPWLHLVQVRTTASSRAGLSAGALHHRGRGGHHWATAGRASWRQR
jgi:hypothetical protein